CFLHGRRAPRRPPLFPYTTLFRSDGGLLTARPAPGGLGHVGEIIAIRVSLLHSLLLAGLTPVIAPMAPAAEGGIGAMTGVRPARDRKSTRLNSRHVAISYAVLCLK